MVGIHVSGYQSRFVTDLVHAPNKCRNVMGWGVCVYGLYIDKTHHNTHITWLQSSSKPNKNKMTEDERVPIAVRMSVILKSVSYYSRLVIPYLGTHQVLYGMMYGNVDMDLGLM